MYKLKDAAVKLMKFAYYNNFLKLCNKLDAPAVSMMDSMIQFYFTSTTTTTTTFYYLYIPPLILLLLHEFEVKCDYWLSGELKSVMQK